MVEVSSGFLDWDRQKYEPLMLELGILGYQTGPACAGGKAAIVWGQDFTPGLL